MILNDVSCFTVYWWDSVFQMPDRYCPIIRVPVMKTRPHWITSSAAPSLQCHHYPEVLAPPLTTRLGLLASKFERAGALDGSKRTSAGPFSRWSEGRRWRARPWHRGAYAGCCGNGRQRHCLYSAPIAWPQVLQALQALQALRRSLVAHVEPQRLMGLAVVHDRLLIAVERQRAQLVGDLFRE